MSDEIKVESREDKIRKIANDLIGEGTYQDIDEFMESAGIENLTDDEYKIIDTIVFKCVGCSWYCAASEINEVDSEWKCDDCAKDE